MPDYLSLTKKITEQTGVSFRAASSSSLKKVESLGVPSEVLAFYRDFEPSECVEGQVRLWPIQHVLAENEDYVPGCYASKHGYIVFASTFCGDAYCFDLTQHGPTEPSVVLLSHEVITKDTDASQFMRLAKPVARSLHEFLELFVRGEIDEDCIYS